MWPLPIWVVALVVAAFAPTMVRLLADRLERRAREQTRALLGRAAPHADVRDDRATPASNASRESSDADAPRGEPERSTPRGG